MAVVMQATPKNNGTASNVSNHIRVDLPIPETFGKILFPFPKICLWANSIEHYSRSRMKDADHKVLNSNFSTVLLPCVFLGFTGQ